MFFKVRVWIQFTFYKIITLFFHLTLFFVSTVPVVLCTANTEGFSTLCWVTKAFVFDGGNSSLPPAKTLNFFYFFYGKLLYCRRIHVNFGGFDKFQFVRPKNVYNNVCFPLLYYIFSLFCHHQLFFFPPSFRKQGSTWRLDKCIPGWKISAFLLLFLL